jgi:hypothetical protein
MAAPIPAVEPIAPTDLLGRSFQVGQHLVKGCHGVTASSKTDRHRHPHRHPGRKWPSLSLRQLQAMPALPAAHRDTHQQQARVDAYLAARKDKPKWMDARLTLSSYSVQPACWLPLCFETNEYSNECERASSTERRVGSSATSMHARVRANCTGDWDVGRAGGWLTGGLLARRVRHLTGNPATEEAGRPHGHSRCCR